MIKDPKGQFSKKESDGRKTAARRGSGSAKRAKTATQKRRSLKKIARG